MFKNLKQQFQYNIYSRLRVQLYVLRGESDKNETRKCKFPYIFNCTKA